jgi:hypothetical protein
MPRQAYVSFSDLAWEKAGCPEFEALKSGFIGHGQGYKIISGVPPTARLVSVIYLYEDDSLPNVFDPLKQPPTVIVSAHG